MSISIASNFSEGAALPLDSRIVAADNTARDAIASGVRFDGLSVYVVATNITWQLQGGVANANWISLSSSGADTALSNLATVAINAPLTLGTSDAFALGSATKMWSDLYLASGGVVNWNNGNVTLTHSAGKLAFGFAGAEIASLTSAGLLTLGILGTTHGQLRFNSGDIAGTRYTTIEAVTSSPVSGSPAMVIGGAGAVAMDVVIAPAYRSYWYAIGGAWGSGIVLGTQTTMTYTGGPQFLDIMPNISNASGVGSAVHIHPTWAQTGTSSAVDLIVNSDGTYGSGGHLLMDLKKASVSKFSVNGNGNTIITQSVITTGSPTALLVTGGAHTTLTASTEAIDVNFNLARTVQFATGDFTEQRAMVIQAPTYSFVGASTVMIASTVCIDGAPITGTNATIMNTVGLNVGTIAGWVSKSDSALSMAVVIPGIADGVGNVSARLGIGFFGPMGGSTSLGNQTATIGDLMCATFEGGNFASTTNTRTVNGKIATVYISGAPQAGSNVVFSVPAYSLWVDDGDTRLDRNLLMGTSVAGSSAAGGVIALSNAASAPTTSVDLAHVYCTDVSAGNAVLAVYQEMAPYGGIAVASTTKIPVKWNGVTYYLLATTIA